MPAVRAEPNERVFDRAALDSVPGVLCVFAADGRFLEWSRSLETVSGYTGAEIASMRLVDFLSESDRASAMAALDAALLHGSGAIDCDLVSKSGVATAHAFSGRRIDLGGKRCVVGMAIDVSERNRAVSALREREEVLRRTLDESPIAIALVALDGTIEYVNRHAVETFGYVLSDIPTMAHWWVLAYPEQAYREEVVGRWMGLLEKAITLGTEIERGEYQVTCKDGTVKSVVIFGSLVAGKAAVMFEDITEPLRERENNLAALAENAHDGIVISNAVGEPRYVNRRAAEISGYSADELLRMNVETLAHPDDAPWLTERLPLGPTGISAVAHSEKRVVTKSGEIVPVEISTAFTLWSGQPANLFVVRDISERCRAEEEREKLQAQLAHAQKMEALGTLAGGVAHDFNNILASLLGGLALLDLEVAGDEALHADIREMKAAVERGAGLAKQLLGLARRGKYHVEPLSLAPAVEKTCTLFARTHKEIIFERDVPPELWAVLMDHTQLEQVLLNLFVNAGHAMPEGGHLLLRAENVHLTAADVDPHGAAPGRYVKMFVRDTGVGMDAVTLGRVFEPFFTTKDPGQGTGLGLASVYGIVRNHGGFIEVESRLGLGTTFTLFLPAADLPEASTNESLEEVHGGAGTILVVDDEAEVAGILARMLRRLGYDVLTASSGKQGVELARLHADSIALVILDMVMPEMSGRQTYAVLREVAPAIKVLLSSGYSLEGQAQEILDGGCDGFLQKPFDIVTLAAKMREIL